MLAAFGSSACATIVRGAEADLSIDNAPPNLLAFDRAGEPLPLERTADGTAHAKVSYKTDLIFLKSDGKTAAVVPESRVAIGFVICDILLDLFPLLIDWATSKWTNFDDIDARLAFAAPIKSGGPDPWLVHEAHSAAHAPAAEIVHESAAPLVQPAPSQPAASQPALAQPAASADRRAAIFSSGKLAVLDFKSYTDALKPEDVRYFTDVVRGQVLKAAPALQVMTRENLLVLLQATGKDATACEGECEVDTGRRIGADAVISGEILKVGSHFKLSLKLHETREGRLLSTSVASGKSIDELDEGAQKAALDLIAPAH